MLNAYKSIPVSCLKIFTYAAHISANSSYISVRNWLFAAVGLGLYEGAELFCVPLSILLFVFIQKGGLHTLAIKILMPAAFASLKNCTRVPNGLCSPCIKVFKLNFERSVTNGSALSFVYSKLVGTSSRIMLTPRSR